MNSLSRPRSANDNNNASAPFPTNVTRTNRKDTADVKTTATVGLFVGLSLLCAVVFVVVVAATAAAASLLSPNTANFFTSYFFSFSPDRGERGERRERKEGKKALDRLPRHIGSIETKKKVTHNWRYNGHRYER